MTIEEMIERLEEYKSEFGGDCEVRLMTQQNYPFENAITGLAANTEFNDDDAPEDYEECDGDDEEEPIVYICEGSQLGYGTEKAWRVAY